MRVATKYTEHGQPIYTTTVKQELGKLTESDNKINSEILLSLREVTNSYPSDVKFEDVVISDLFFHSEVINDCSGEITSIHQAATLFREELWPEFRSRYSVQWLVRNFFRRL